MRIRMIKTERGSVDGCRVQQYEAEQEYDLSATPGAADLARAFVGAGLAEEIDAVPASPSAAEPEAAQAAEPASETGESPAPLKPGRKAKVP